MKFYIFLIVALAVLVGGGYFFWTQYPEQIQQSLPLRLEESGDFFTYTPSSYKDSSTKRGVIINYPGDTKDDGVRYMKLWKNTADTYGLKLISHDFVEFKDFYSVAPWVSANTDVEKIYMTGLSGGGYTSCSVGLDSQDVVDGVIPMAAYCRDFDLEEDAQKIPILTVIGEFDDWALGETGDFPYQEKEIDSDFIIVKGLGHAFPVNAMDEVGEWILAH